MRKALILLISTLALLGCTGNTLVHHYEHTSPSGWLRSDTLHFEIPEVKETGYYRMSTGLRTTNSFPYEGLYLVVETRLQDPAETHCDTLNFSTTDTKGNPNGAGINLQQYEVPVTNLTLREGQHGQVCIYHIMSREEIPGIRDVGLMLEAVSSGIHTQEDK